MIKNSPDEVLKGFSVRGLRKVRDRLYAATVAERSASVADLLVAIRFCNAMRLIPEYSLGNTFESLRLQFETVLPAAMARWRAEEERRAVSRGVKRSEPA